MDVLVVLGTTSGFVYSLVSVFLACWAGGEASHFFETSAMLITFVMLGRTLEAAAKGEASDAVASLLRLAPEKCTLLVPCRGGSEGLELQKTLVKHLQVGDLVAAELGDALPCDGVVCEECEVLLDQSQVTGESAPVRKRGGDFVIAGSIVRDVVAGSSLAPASDAKRLVFEATRVGKDSFIQQLVTLVERAQASKAPIQLVADRIAAIFVPAIVALSVLTFVVWYGVCCLGLVPKEWVGHDGTLMFCFLFANAVVVVACPCALGLATPTAVMVGAGVGARLGILIKSGAALEVAHKVTAVVFDKTGTLTQGNMSVANSRFFGSRSEAELLDLWQWVSWAEEACTSHHPIATAVISHATAQLRQNSRTPVRPPQGIVAQAVAGCGITARVPAAACGRSGDVRVLVGKQSWLEEQGVDVARGVGGEVVGGGRGGGMGGMQGLTLVAVAVEGEMVGVIGLSDRVKEGARELVKALQMRGLTVLMVSGDNRGSCEAVARRVGMEEAMVAWEVMPGGKAAAIEDLQGRGEVVAMVGDGVNDAVALAKADCAVALGAGADVALDAADIVLVQNKLEHVLTALDLSKSIVARIWMNYVFALGYNLTAIPLASGALFPLTHVRLHPAVAGLCMALSSVSVVVSSLLLRRYRPPLLPSLDSVCDDSGRDGAVSDVEGAEGSWAWRRMLWETHSDVKDQRVGSGLDGEQTWGKGKRGRADTMAKLRPSMVAAKARGYSQIASGVAS